MLNSCFNKLRFFVCLILASNGAFAEINSVISEMGPLLNHRTLLLPPRSTPYSYRVESYGNTVLEMNILRTGTTVPPILIEGPLENAGDLTPIGEGPILQTIPISKTLNIRRQIPLQKAGLYRVIFTTEVPGFTRTTLSIRTQCVQNCTRPEISISDLLEQFRKTGRLPELTQAFEAKIQTLISNPTIVEKVITEFRQILGELNFKQLDHFPVIPVQHFSTLRGLYQLFQPHVPAQEDPVVRGSLENLLGPCSAPRVGPVAEAGLPNELKYGHFADQTLSPCQNAHSQSFARILTALAVRQNSHVNYRGTTIVSAAQLIDTLLQHGHSIEMHRENTYANFFSFTVNDSFNLRWPTWLDTGIQLPTGELKIPAGHSQYVWKISGPTVNAQFTFFLGIRGSGFFPKTDVRPTWTGTHRWATVEFNSDHQTFPEHKELIFRTFRFAEDYLQLNRREQDGPARGMPAGGYGFVGTCTDSVCFVEKATLGTCSSYPLVRDPQLNYVLPLPFYRLISSLPNDLAPQNQNDVLRRIDAMRPHSLHAELWFDSELYRQMESIKRLLQSN